MYEKRSNFSYSFAQIDVGKGQTGWTKYVIKMPRIDYVEKIQPG